MKAKFRLTTTFLALVTAAGVAACGADDKDKKEDAPTAKKGGKPDPKPVVEMKTSLGTITIELNREKSPITVDNFLKYVEKKHYDNTIFHRVIKTFMIQGGGFVKGPRRQEKPTMPPIKNEAKTNGLKNEKYTIAMARTGAPHSATSQFFINVVDNRKGLDPGGFSADGYAVFGKVIGGTDVVDKIKSVPTVPGSPENAVPVEQVVIESVRLVEKKKSEAKPEEKK